MLIKGKAVTFFAVTVLFVSAAVSASGMSRRPPEPPYVPGRILLKFQEGVTEKRALELIEGEGARLEEVLPRTGLHLVILPEDTGVPEAVERFSRYPEVLSAEPDARAEPLQ